MKRYVIFLLLIIPILIAMQLQVGKYSVIEAKPTEQIGEDSSLYIPIVGNDALFVDWAFEESFDGDPASPSQALLPDNFDYVVTHRSHPREHFRVFDTYLADHDDQCAGPDPGVSPLPQHLVRTSHNSNGSSPDESFYICKNHMMSSMGEVDAYSVTSFWPLQEFDFSRGGYLEFDVNINDSHPRSWFEILITPRSELKVGAAPADLPIDEAYPKDRIVLQYDHRRKIQVGTNAVDPQGIIVEKRETTHEFWREKYPNDPAVNDRRIRRKMRIYISDNEIVWWIQKSDRTYDEFRVNVPGGLPFHKGLVLFKTHAYRPTKDNNLNTYTYHWDNIRFSGPVVGRYERFDANDVVYLQANGDRAIGEKETVTVDLPHLGPNPILFGQVHQPKRGQVLLSINGRSNITIEPYDYHPGTCSSTGWKSFQLKLDPTWLKQGSNTFTWTIGPRQNCADQNLWDGFSVKDLEIQLDLPN